MSSIAQMIVSSNPPSRFPDFPRAGHNSTPASPPVPSPHRATGTASIGTRTLNRFDLEDQMSPGKFKPVPGATSYKMALMAYMNACGLTLGQAHRWAQHNHDDLWTVEKRRLGDAYAAMRAKNRPRD